MSTAVDLGVLTMGLYAMTTDPVLPPMKENVERATSLELATSGLGSRRSTN